VAVLHAGLPKPLFHPKSRGSFLPCGMKSGQRIPAEAARRRCGCMARLRCPVQTSARRHVKLSSDLGASTFKGQLQPQRVALLLRCKSLGCEIRNLRDRGLFAGILHFSHQRTTVAQQLTDFVTAGLPTLSLRLFHRCGILDFAVVHAKHPIHPLSLAQRPFMCSSQTGLGHPFVLKLACTQRRLQASWLAAIAARAWPLVRGAVKTSSKQKQG